VESVPEVRAPEPVAASPSKEDLLPLEGSEEVLSLDAEELAEDILEEGDDLELPETESDQGNEE